jgi:hypothetical protein
VRSLKEEFTKAKEEEFHAFVHDNLVPLWTRFPGAQSVQVFREAEAEDSSHRYPIILQISYLSREAVETALNSPIRFTSREVTKTLLQIFEGRVFHVIYEDDHSFRGIDQSPPLRSI